MKKQRKKKIKTDKLMYKYHKINIKLKIITFHNNMYCSILYIQVFFLAFLLFYTPKMGDKRKKREGLRIRFLKEI